LEPACTIRVRFTRPTGEANFQQFARCSASRRIFPNCRGPQGVGDVILESAIDHSPLGFIRSLLEFVELLLAAGADIQQRGGSNTGRRSTTRLPPTIRGDRALARGADPNARTRIDGRATRWKRPRTSADPQRHGCCASLCQAERRPGRGRTIR
jgi:hypothetical protein